MKQYKRSVYWILGLFLFLAGCTNGGGSGETTPVVVIPTPETARSTPTLAVAPATATAAAPVATVTTEIPSPTSTPIPVIPTPTVPSEPSPIPIVFDPGAISATVTGTINPGEMDEYNFRALEGQWARLEITPADGSVSFGLSGLSDGIPYKRIPAESPAWSGRLLRFFRKVRA